MSENPPACPSQTQSKPGEFPAHPSQIPQAASGGFPPYPHPGMPPQYMQSEAVFRGQKHAQNALIFGIIGLFILGIVFGPLAIVQAGRSQALGQPATAGRVLGWISLIFGILGTLYFIISIAMAFYYASSY